MDRFEYSQAMKEIEFFLWHELADHYLEMVKDSIYKKENLESIQYTLFTVGEGILKLFAPFFPHITEEIYQNIYIRFGGEKSIHVSPWPGAVFKDERKENAGETIKSYIAQVRSWKSEQGIALNAPIQAIATYAEKDYISKIEPSRFIIHSTLKYPLQHRYITGKPDIEERITSVSPVYAKLGPTFKTESQKIVKWLQENQEKAIILIEKNGDIFLSDIHLFPESNKQRLLKEGFIQIKKEISIKGKRGSIVHPFDGFYLEYSKETL